MSLRRLFATALVLLTITAVVAGTRGGRTDRVTIGVVAPLSGARAYLGEEIKNGVTLAVAELNRDGGLLGSDVELVVVDDADLVQLPAQLARLAERDRVTAIIGPEAPGILLSPRSPLARRDVPALLPASFSGDLGEAPAPVVRTIPSAAVQARTLGWWLTEVREVTDVAVVVADPTEGAAVTDALTEGLRSGGVEDVAVLEVPASTSRFDPAIGSLRSQAPDAGALLIWAPPPVAARATVAVRRVGWDVQLSVPASAFVSEYRTLAGEASEGVVLAFPFRREWFTGTELMSFLLRYHGEHGLGALPQLDTLVLDVPVVATAAYDATKLVAAAVEQAGSAAPRPVGEALDEVVHDGLLKTYSGLGDGETWEVSELHVARFHHLAITFDVDPRLDPDYHRRFWRSQVSADYLLEVLEGPALDLARRLIERQGPPPEYTPPLPPPGPVARP
ncbi:MAG: ABC transporter substrate-binding protein [Nitriliruptorales bacterium]|nr:ABC transporter substrate-binding protein [Nitriliruptorales bacterium]